MNEWDEKINGQETQPEAGQPVTETAELPINGSEAVEEALREKEAEEARRQQEAIRLAQEAARERQLLEEQEAERARAYAAEQRQKEAARKQKKRRKRQSFLTVLCALLSVAALAVSVVSYQSLQRMKGDLSTLQNQVSAKSESVVTRQGNLTGTDINGSGNAVSASEFKTGTTSLTDVSDIVAEAIRSVVSIEVTGTKKTSSFYGTREYQTQGAGSGVIIGQNETELWIATNHHVIEDANEITVVFCDEKKISAYLKGTNQEHDLAVLGIQLDALSQETLDEIRLATIGDSDILRLGEGVIAIGNALGWGQSVTTGVVSALERNVTFSDETTMNLLQISAAINPGNSGGALLNAKGELIGINNAKYSDEEVEGVGFAIPISSILDVMQELSLKEARVPVSEDEYPYMGITFRDLSSAYHSMYGIPLGAYVDSVGKGTPAEEAGILPYDVITALDGEKIESYADLVGELQYHKGGTEVEVTVMRLEKGSYNEIKLTITLGFKKNITS